MTVKVGVPRGMYFYKYYPFAKSFLEELGAEIIPSPETTKEILDIGVRYCIDDACLPVKVYHGHAYKLRGDADYLLVPRLTSIYEKEYICPKFGGLPEMIKYSIPDIPPLIDIEINLHKSSRQLEKSIYELSHMLGIHNPFRIRRAFKHAKEAQLKYKEKLMAGNTPDRILKNQTTKNERKKYTIGVIGHPYLLYDSFINMKLLSKLNEWNIRYITPEMLNPEILHNRCSEMPKRMFWSSAKALIGSTYHLIDNPDIDGLLFITAFGCGIDSISLEYIENVLKKQYSKPYIILSVDEHTGDAGYNTRLEAFLSLLDWRYNSENNIPAYGGSIHSSKSGI